MNKNLVIAVDGPAASGKGTIAARLAAHYGLPYLDTGLLYRAVGLAVLDAGGDLGDGGRWGFDGAAEGRHGLDGQADQQGAADAHGEARETVGGGREQIEHDGGPLIAMC